MLSPLRPSPDDQNYNERLWLFYPQQLFPQCFRCPFGLIPLPLVPPSLWVPHRPILNLLLSGLCVPGLLVGLSHTQDFPSRSANGSWSDSLAQTSLLSPSPDPLRSFLPTGGNMCSPAHLKSRHPQRTCWSFLSCASAGELLRTRHWGRTHPWSSCFSPKRNHY